MSAIERAYERGMQEGLDLRDGLRERIGVLTEQLAAAVGLLRDVGTSGVEYEDPRVGYIAVQIDRGTWEVLAPYRSEVGGR